LLSIKDLHLLLNLCELLVPETLLLLGLIATDLSLLPLDIIFLHVILRILRVLHLTGILECLLLLCSLKSSFPNLRLGIRIADLQHFEVAVDAPEFLSGLLKHLFHLSSVVLEFFEILSLQTFYVEDMTASKDFQFLC